MMIWMALTAAASKGGGSRVNRFLRYVYYSRWAAGLLGGSVSKVKRRAAAYFCGGGLPG